MVEIDDRVIGLDVGVDDYLIKFFFLKELLVRFCFMFWRLEDFIFNVLLLGRVILLVGE